MSVLDMLNFIVPPVVAGAVVVPPLVLVLVLVAVVAAAAAGRQNQQPGSEDECGCGEPDASFPPAPISMASRPFLACSSFSLWVVADPTTCRVATVSTGGHGLTVGLHARPLRAHAVARGAQAAAFPPLAEREHVGELGLAADRGGEPLGHRRPVLEAVAGAAADEPDVRVLRDAARRRSSCPAVVS